MIDGGNQERIQQWIVSLVVTVVCCAVFFLAFAGHFMDMQKEVTTARVEIGMLEARLNYLENNILWGQHHQAAAAQKETAVPILTPQHKTENMPNVALPSVEAPTATTPPVKQVAPARPALNVPHEFNPDENNVPSNVTPIEMPKKP